MIGLPDGLHSRYDGRTNEEGVLVWRRRGRVRHYAANGCCCARSGRRTPTICGWTCKTSRGSASRACTMRLPTRRSRPTAPRALIRSTASPSPSPTRATGPTRARSSSWTTTRLTAPPACGLALASTARGQGLGAEALRVVLAHAFGPLGLHRVSLEVYDFNERAIHVYEKVGFRHEGRMRDAL